MTTSSPLAITYAALLAGGACTPGIAAARAALIAGGVDIPEEGDAEVPLLTVLDVLGLSKALEAAEYVRLDIPELRLFAADCAERALLREREVGREPDARSWKALEVARAFIRGEATREELNAAAAAAARAAAAAAARANAAYAAERDWQTARLRAYLTGGDLPLWTAAAQ